MYFCKNCGEMYATDEAVVCVKCGVARNAGNNFCHNCGNALSLSDTACFACGVSAYSTQATESFSSASYVSSDLKSKILAGLLALFFGCFGVHNFYLGYTGKAVTQLVLTIVGFLLCCIVIGVFLVLGIYIWSFIEGIMILCGKINCDAQGNPLGN